MFDRMPALPPMIMRAITAGTLGGLDLLKTAMRFLSPRGLFWFVNATAAWATGTDVIVRGHRGRRLGNTHKRGFEYTYGNFKNVHNQRPPIESLRIRL